MEMAMKQSLRYMLFGAILAVVLGITMIAYPGGTMTMMAATFWMLQVIISVFILSAAISDAIKLSKAGRKGTAIAHLLLGLAAVILVWVFDVRVVYLICSLFFILTGISEILTAFSLPGARFFYALQGFLNIMVGAIMLQYPVMLPLLLAWYILFWGVSRIFLNLELRRIFTA